MNSGKKLKKFEKKICHHGIFGEIAGDRDYESQLYSKRTEIPVQKTKIEIHPK